MQLEVMFVIIRKFVVLHQLLTRIRIQTYMISTFPLWVLGSLLAKHTCALVSAQHICAGGVFGGSMHYGKPL